MDCIKNLLVGHLAGLGDAPGARVFSRAGHGVEGELAMVR